MSGPVWRRDAEMSSYPLVPAPDDIDRAARDAWREAWPACAPIVERTRCDVVLVGGVVLAYDVLGLDAAGEVVAAAAARPASGNRVVVEHVARCPR